MRQPRILMATLLAVALCLPLSAWATRYEIGADDQSEVVFVSKAPMETFKGRTRLVSGWFEADLGNLAGEVSLAIEVDLASFDTGMKKRNQHMRDNHLETGKFPTARFTAGSIVSASPAAISAGQRAEIKLLGTLDLHGVQKEMECLLNVGLDDKGAVRVSGEFPVKLSDFAIDRPKFLVMKLADEQRVQLDLLAVQPAPGGSP
jgi:polyisoprenoid-binding protein YceI